MAKKIEELEALLTELTAERDALESAIDTTIGEMAEASEEERGTGDWASDGAATRLYLERSRRLAEVEQGVVDVARELAAARQALN